MDQDARAIVPRTKHHQLADTLVGGPSRPPPPFLAPARFLRTVDVRGERSPRGWEECLLELAGRELIEGLPG